MKNIKDIIERGTNFYQELKKDNNGRYRSWEYCYKTFYDAHNSKNVDEAYLDYLCLHLAFYLASWGMYRGSSFLLQKDYKIHKAIIEELLKKKYNSLWGISVNDYKNKYNLDLLFDLKKVIKEKYNEIRLSVKETIPRNELSDTLITKVLMGTMGCVPAYDRYFISGIRYNKIASGVFSQNSIMELLEFYSKYYDEFEEARNRMFICDLKYPQMKIIDMCFWQIGFDIDTKKGLKISH